MKQNIIIILSISVVLLIILGISFYWFQLRPTQIRQECANEARMFGSKILDDSKYEDCIKLHGLVN